MLAPAVEGTAAATAQLQELLAKDMKYVTVADLSEALEGGADVNGTVGGRGGRDWTALMHASENGDCDVVEQLLKRGAAVDVQTMLGDTSLMIASATRHEGVVGQVYFQMCRP